MESDRIVDPRSIAFGLCKDLVGSKFLRWDPCTRLPDRDVTKS